MEENLFLKNYYENYDEDSRLVSKHGSVEFLTTVRYIEKYLIRGMKIIEIGAGTGRYSHYFAKKGYSVDAVELIQHNIDVLNSKIEAYEPITVTKADARDLTKFKTDTYDITLLLGPMYHLYSLEDQRKAMAEALRVTKKGGIVFAAYCNNDSTVYQFCFARGNIFNERYKDLINYEMFELKSTPAEVFELYRKEKIDNIMSCFGIDRLHYVGTDMLTSFIAEAVDKMDEKTFEKYMDFHYCICERADMVGATNHILDIFRKE